jgi:hypothetical protein
MRKRGRGRERYRGEERERERESESEREWRGKIFLDICAKLHDATPRRPRK